MGDARVGLLVVAAAVVLPATTALQLHALSRLQAITETPLLMFSLTALLVLAALVAADDAWLGAFVALTAGQVLVRPTAYALDVAQWVAFGALVVVVARRLPEAWRSRVHLILVLVGVLQAAYATLQWLGRDPIFVGWAPLAEPRHVMGTLGNPNYLGALLALLLPLAPVWALPLLAVGLVLGHSVLGCLAAAVGLMVRYGRGDWRLWAVSIAATGGALVAVALAKSASTLGTFGVRLTIWKLGLWDWALATERSWGAQAVDVLLGKGPGSWYERVPGLQRRFWISGHEWFAQAHSEVVQLVYEWGVAGLVCLVGWLWAMRARWRTPEAAAVAAFGVVCLGMFPLRLAVVALPALVLLGLATPPRTA